MSPEEYERFVAENPQFELPRFHLLTDEFRVRFDPLTVDDFRAWLTEQALLDNLRLATQEIWDVPF